MGRTFRSFTRHTSRVDSWTVPFRMNWFICSSKPRIITEVPMSRVLKDSPPGRRSRVREVSPAAYPVRRAPSSSWHSGVSTVRLMPLCSSGREPEPSSSSPSSS